MIQILNSSYAAGGGNASTFYLGTYDAYEDKDNIEFKPIITLTSQMTGNSVNFLPSSYDYTNKDRYVQITIAVTPSGTGTSTKIILGNTDFPYGFYDIIIRENTTNNLPSEASIPARNKIYVGVANASSTSTGIYKNPAVEYTEYTTNDSETESVYITA